MDYSRRGCAVAVVGVVGIVAVVVVVVGGGGGRGRHEGGIRCERLRTEDRFTGSEDAVCLGRGLIEMGWPLRRGSRRMGPSTCLFACFWRFAPRQRKGEHGWSESLSCGGVVLAEPRLRAAEQEPVDYLRASGSGRIGATMDGRGNGEGDGWWAVGGGRGCRQGTWARGDAVVGERMQCQVGGAASGEGCGRAAGAAAGAAGGWD